MMDIAYSGNPDGSLSGKTSLNSDSKSSNCDGNAGVVGETGEHSRTITMHVSRIKDSNEER